MDAGDADEKSGININEDDDDDNDLQLCAKKGVGQRHRRHQCPRSFQASNTTPQPICVFKVWYANLFCNMFKNCLKWTRKT